MKIKLIIAFALFISNFVFSQEAETLNSFKASEDVNALNPIGFYSNYFSEIQINSKWAFRQEVLQFSINEYSQFEFPLLMKYKITPKWNMLFGPKVNIYKDKSSGQIEHISLFSSFGIQYDATKNLLFESRFDTRLDNGNSISKNYIFDSDQTYRLGSKFKF